MKRKILRKVAAYLIVIVLSMGSSEIAFAACDPLTPSMTDYTAYPPFISQSIPPNVLIVLDNSGSMCGQAYAGSYDPSNFANGLYYGYFDGAKNYKYTGNNRWEVTTDPMNTGNPANPIASGSFLNWATMRRDEVAKKLLIGGKANPRSPVGAVTVKLTGETACGFPANFDMQKDYDTSAGNLIYPFVGNYRFTRSDSSDDLYISPVTGGTDTFYTYPTSDISVPAGWSEFPAAGAVTAWDKVDETPSDSDTTYIENSNTTSPVILGYNYTQAEPAGVITVTVQVRAKQTAAGATRRIRGVIRIDGVNYESNTSNLTTSYATYSFAWANNPATAAAWTWAEIKAIAGSGNLQGFGARADANYASRYPRVTQVYLNVSITMPTGGPYNTIVDQGMVKAEGIIDTLTSDVRFGLAYYSGVSSDGGRIDTYVGFGMATNMITSIQNMNPSTYTPLAETLYEMTRYFRQDDPYYSNSPADYSLGANGANIIRDPYWYKFTDLDASLTDMYVPCAKSFVLFLTDGESTRDENIPGAGSGACSLTNIKGCSGDGSLPNPRFAGTAIGTTYPLNGTDYMIDVAYWARTNDMRSGACTAVPTSYQQCLPNTQNVITYPVFMFGQGSTLLKDVSIYGGFIDMDGNNMPDCTTIPAECYRDTDGDGTIESNGDDDPLTYYEGDDGYALETSIMNAISEILKRASSGTAVSVLSTTGEGEGAIFQSLFHTSKMEGFTEIKWLGYVQGLFVDSGGNLREDTDSDLKLDIDPNLGATDRIVRMWFDENYTLDGRKVKVDRFEDVDGNAIFDCVDRGGDRRIGNTECPYSGMDYTAYDDYVDTYTDFDMLKTLWEAGGVLFTKNPDTRKIYTTIDGSSFLANDFTASNASTLRPYLRATDASDATNIIDYIRGTDLTGYRSRTRTVSGVTDVWKLGDIVYSSPVSIGKPNENYDITRNDSSFVSFETQYKNRRNVVYAGGNDGMLHAFNSGFYDATNHQFSDTTGYSLGEELWAFIPRDLLPHLKWLTDPTYTHVYYVDLKPRIASVRIFSNSATHPDGWGTILIGGMRLGGKDMCVTDDFGSGTEDRTFMSTYFALDVTDPLNPRLLWTFTDTDLGLSAVYPAIIRVRTDSSLSNSADLGRWFVVFGSGPTSYDGSSVNEGKVYTIDMNSGTDGVITAWTLNTNYWKFSTGDSNAFMADAIALDADSNYTHDVAYIGEAYKLGSDWRGKMFRLVTGSDTNPSNWTFSTLYDSGNKPITSSPTSTLDTKGNLWVYFGTGRFFSTTDKTDLTVQSFYGIKEVCKPWISTNYGCITAVTQADLLNTSAAVVTYGGASVTGVSGVANWSDLLTVIDTKKGWYINFDETPAEGDSGEPMYYYPPASQRAGQRVITKPVVASGIAVWETYVPSSDICFSEGSSYMHVANYETGTAHKGYTYKREAKVTKPGTVGRSVYLGVGAPSAISIMIPKGGGVKGFAQTSTGEIKDIELESILPTFGFGSSSTTGGWKARGVR